MFRWFDLPFWKNESVDIFESLDDDIRAGKSVLPHPTNMLKAFQLTLFEHTKVVIIGQDPYPTMGHANGLAFSVMSGTPLPKSLVNIFKELKNDLGIERTDGNLTDWATQGVLLLNTSLSVIEGKPGSHSDIGWGILTDQVLAALSTYKENVVFIFWGNHAIERSSHIDSSKHLIITSPHPSPLAAYRGFFDSKPFSRTNNYLLSKGLTPINW